MKNIIYLSTFFLTFFSFAQGNEYINSYDNSEIEAPSAFTFYDYSNMGSVSHLTGSFGINIPFHEIKTPFLSLPILLSYSTNGVKINQMSNEIGMDWNLLAGGTINRVKNDVEDDRGSNISFYPKSIGDIGYYDFVPNEYINLEPLYRPNFSYGSERGYATCLLGSHYINQFPKRYNPDQQVLSEIGCLAEIKMYEEFSYESYNGPVKLDTEADYYRFNVGKQSFTFVLKRKDNDFYHSSGNSLVDAEIYFEATPLDDIAVKIKPYFGQINPFYIKYKNLGRTTTTPGSSNVHSKAILKFEITDKDGIVYVFDKFQFTDFDVIQETVHDFQGSIQGKRVIQYKEFDTNIDTWYLTKIILPNNENIDFSYEKNEYMFLKDIPREHDGQYLNYPYNLNPRKTPYSFNRIDIHIEGYSISEINYNNQKIKFSYDNDRLDYRTGELHNYNSTASEGLNLKKIELFNHNNLIKKFDLIKEFYARYDDGHEDNRMFLKQIIDSQQKESYRFSYDNPEGLPKRNEVRYQDLFGYFLGYSNETFPSFPKVYISPNDTNGNKISYEIPNSSTYFVINGTNRTPTNLAKKGTMNRIDFPTQGYLTTDYENNTYYDNRLLSKSSLGPGVRVQRIKYYDSDSSLKKSILYEYNLFTNNQYSSGELLYKPSFAYVSNWAFNNEYNRANYENIPAQLDILSVDRNNHYIKHNFDNYYTKEKLKSQFLLSDENIYKKIVHFSNYSMGKTEDIYGREIMYKNVSEKFEDIANLSQSNGYVKYYFKYVDNRGIINSITGPSDESSIFTPGLVSLSFGFFSPFYYINNNNEYLKTSSGFIEKQGKEIFPFPERNFHKNKENASFGKLEKKEVYNSQGQIVLSEEHTYDFVQKAPVNNNSMLNNIQTSYLKTHQYKNTDVLKNFYKILVVPPTKFHDANRQNFTGYYFFGNNEMRFNSKLVLKSTIIKEYFDNSLNYVAKNFTYNYDNQTGNLFEELFESNIGIAKKTYTYPYYDSGDLAIDNLFNKNRISKPISVYSYLDGSLLNYSEEQYLIDQNSLAFLSKIKINNEVRFEFSKYNDKGQLVEMSKIGGAKRAYIYGYNNSEIVAKLENIDYNLIPASLITAIQAITDSPTATEAQILNALNALRTSTDVNMQNAMITTYTYNPLIGISSITDPKGDIITYTYDTSGRLQFVKDKAGNILSENEYHYKN